MVAKAGWEHFPHYADVGVRGWGATAAQAFETISPFSVASHPRRGPIGRSPFAKRLGMRLKIAAKVIIGGFAEQSAELTLGAVFSAPIHRYASQQSGREPEMSGKTMFDPSQCQDLLSSRLFLMQGLCRDRP
jgi:hypothetical protein